MGKSKHVKGFGTLCVEHTELTKKIQPHAAPIYATSGYLFDNTEDAMQMFLDRDRGYLYSRWANPTVELCELKIAQLETQGTKQQAYAQMFSSGMAAVSSAILSCVLPGEKILTQNLLYGTTVEFMHSQLATFGIDVLHADLHHLDRVEKTLKKEKKIKLLYIESPSNPILEVFDIKTLTSIAKKYGCKVIVDNTFATPYLQKPLLSGADLVVHSTTKYLNGHGTGLAGVVVGSDKKLVKESVWAKVKLLGCNANAWDAWLVLNGIKTLELRMLRHCENAMKIAAFLEQQKAVKRVNYPGLKSHMQHKLAKQQMSGFGGMLSFELWGGLQAGIRFMNHVRVGKLITSLGTTDTIMLHPASMSHVNVAPEQRLRYGISDGLVRLSAGLENADDIIADLKQALKKI